jgi:WD40 repeat protein
LLTVKEVGIARIWDVESGEPMGEIRPNSPLGGRFGVGPSSSPFQVFIESAALDKKGEYALLGLNDGTAGIFRVSDGTRLSVLHQPGTQPGEAWSLIRAVAFAPDGSLAVVGLSGWTAAVWNTHDGTLRGVFRCPRADQAYDLNDGPRPGLVSSIGISADNRYLFSGYADMTGTIWDLRTGQVVLDLAEHRNTIRALFVDNECARWVTSGGDVREASQQLSPRTIVSNGKRIAEAAFSPNGQSFLSRGTDGEVMFTSVKGEEKVLADGRNDHMSWPESESTLGFDQNGSRWFYPESHNCLCLAGVGEIKKLYRQTSHRKKAPGIPDHSIFQMTSERIDGLVLSPNGNSGVSTGWSGDLEIWDTESGQLRVFVHEPEHAKAVCFSPDGILLAIGLLGQGGPGKPREIKLLSASDGTVTGCLPGHAHQIGRLKFGPDGTWLVSTGLDRRVRLWDVKKKKLVAELKYEDLQYQELAVLADGRILVFRSQCVEVWRGLRSKLATIPLQLAFGERWAISKDQKVIGVTMGSSVAQWSIDDARLTNLFEPTIQSPTRIPNQRLAQELKPAAGALLWEGPGARFIHIGDGPRGWATPLILSADGRLTLIPVANGLALIDLNGHQNVLSVMPFEGRLRATRITKDCAWAVNSDGKVFRWKFGGSEA